MPELLDSSVERRTYWSSRPLKLALFLVVGLLALVAVAALVLSRLDLKSRFETLASDTAGMQVTVGGKVQVRMFPLLHVTLQDVHLRNRGAQVAAIGQADVAVALLPLLHKEVRVHSVSLLRLDLTLERDRNGKLNFELDKDSKSAVPATELPDVSLKDASFTYVNRQTGGEIHATDCALGNGHGALADASNSRLMKRLSLSAKIECAQMRNEKFTGTDVAFEVDGKQGVFEFKPVTMRILGGKGSGTIHADFTNEVPVYQVHYAVAKLRMQELAKTLKAKTTGDGLLDFSTDLSMRGRDAVAMTRTAQGEAVLSGTDLTLEMGNLDEKFSRYESSQNFNLIDVGAFFLAGPLGTAVTKGYNFATVLQTTQGSTPVPTLISHWHIEQGVAHATDVAMATPKNRVAMKGSLNFVDKSFEDVTIALLDEEGCSRVEQKIHGPFAAPQIEQPNVLISLAGPVTRLLRSAKNLVGGKCAAFYTGSVAAPEPPDHRGT